MNVLNKNRKYKLSDKFITNIADLYVGLIDTSLIDDFIYSLEKNLYRFPVNDQTESNLYRILSVRYDKASFAYNCINYPIYSHLLVSIASSSNYLTDILIKDPEYFYSLTNTETLQHKIEDISFYRETKKLLSNFHSFKGKLNSLKSLKRKEILRIGVNDILGYSDVKTTIDQLSVLGKTLASHLFALCYQKVLNKYKIKRTKKDYALVALGKLGGNELNYSSDIDLLLIFNKNIKINKKEYFELLTETIQLFIESSNTVTENGYLYRVDFRLRPDGGTSPLCRTLNDTLHYYETRGEDWERQMLIKASFISGDKKLYNKFIDYLQPFIYPKSFTTSPPEQIKKLKSEIESKLSGEQNIKLIKGGIRDIEFSVQALQLLKGGKIPDVKTSNTLEAIRKLKTNNILSETEANILHSAYYLYRKIEHYQQLKNDRQTHDIPKDRSKLYAMSLYLGFRNSIEFETFLTKTRKDVREIYNSIVVENNKEHNKNNLTDKINFGDIKKAKRNYEYLEIGSGITKQRQFDKNTTKAFLSIEPILIKHLLKSDNPDKLLDNFVKIIRQVKLPSIWYKEINNKKFANALFKVLEHSEKSIELLLNNPTLTDIILSKKVFESLSPKELAGYKIQELLLIITFQYTAGKITHKKFSDILSGYARQKIKNVSEKMLFENIGKNNFLIASMGSFSINEMTLISDIDLIFITNIKTPKKAVEPLFQKFLLEINKQLKPFRCDCRLRPEGKSSQLVWDINGYINYLNTRAKLWELQSLCKINIISGSRAIFNELTKTIECKISDLKIKTLKQQISEMRGKLYPVSYANRKPVFNIKTSPGGILDIDFIVQFYLLSGKLDYKTWRGKPLLKILDHIIKTKRNKKDAEELKKNLIFLKNIAMANQIIFNNKTYNLPNKKEDGIVLGNFLKFQNAEEFEEKLSGIVVRNKIIFQKTFG